MPGEAQTQLRSTTTFRFTTASNRSPLLRVQLAPDVTATFLLDTGSSTCIITDTLAERLHLPVQPAIDTAGNPVYAGKDKQAHMATLPSLHLGTFDLSLDCLVYDHQLLPAMEDGPIDGLLGGQIWSQFAVLFDFQTHQITLWSGGNLSDGERLAANMGGCIKIEAAPSQATLFYIPIRCNGIKTSLAVDTGSGQVVIPTDVARKLKLKPIEPTGETFTFSGPRKSDTVMIDRLEIGPQRIRVPATYFQEEPEHYLFQLGMNVLILYRMLIDYPAKTLYLKPVQSEPSSPSGTPVGNTKQP
jgi:predicted aspartyl protease